MCEAWGTDRQACDQMIAVTVWLLTLLYCRQWYIIEVIINREAGFEKRNSETQVETLA